MEEDSFIYKAAKTVLIMAFVNGACERGGKDVALNLDGLHHLHGGMSKWRKFSPEIDFHLVWDTRTGEVQGKQIVWYWEEKGGGKEMLQEQMREHHRWWAALSQLSPWMILCTYYSSDCNVLYIITSCLVHGAIDINWYSHCQVEQSGMSSSLTIQ